MKPVFLLIFLSYTVTFLSASNSDSDTSDRSYVFMSGKVSLAEKDTFLPIKSFDGKRFHLEGHNKAIKPTRKLSASMRTTMVVSNKFADINEFEYGFDSLMDQLETMHDINEMESEQMRFQAGTEFTNSRLYFGRARPGMTEGDKAVVVLNDLTQDQFDNAVGGPTNSRLVDTFRGRFLVTPKQSLENTYAALLLGLEVVNGEKEEREIVKGSMVRVIAVGDLEEGKRKTIKFGFDFPELNVSSAKVDILLFDGKNKHVATNLSPRLKALTAEQLQQLRETERQAKEKRASQ